MATVEVTGISEKNGFSVGNYKATVKDINNPAVCNIATGIVSLSGSSGKCFIEED